MGLGSGFGVIGVIGVKEGIGLRCLRKADRSRLSPCLA